MVPMRHVNVNDKIALLLVCYWQDLSRGLKELLSYEGDVENDLCQTFQVIKYSICYESPRRIACLTSLLLFLDFLHVLWTSHHP